MKYFFRALIFLVVGILLISCGQSLAATPSPLPLPSETLIPTFTLVPTQTPTATIQPTPRPTYARPTLIPTIDPILVPGLLRNTFSIQTLEGLNRHKVRIITGWDNGFGGGYTYGSCSGYYWLDTDHLLLYPSAGQVRGPEGYWGGINVVPQPIVINLKSGNTWLPPVNASRTCNRVLWSHELGIVIIGNDDSVTTYTFEGNLINRYPGALLDVSPSGTKILLTDSTLIDLKSGKTIDLKWQGGSEFFSQGPFWSSNEAQVFACCYHYGNTHTGESYDFPHDDLYLDGEKATGSLYSSLGEWVLNDSYFLIQWDRINDSNPGFIPLFDPKAKTLLNLSGLANIPTEINGATFCEDTSASPNGKYVWVMCYETNYLINLSNFETKSYPGYSQVDINWSADSKFAWLQNYNRKSEAEQYNLLSISNKELKALSVSPASISWQDLWWHPTDNTFAYISKDSQLLVLFNAENMTSQELTSPIIFTNFTWSPNGDRIALVADNGSVWQVDYPKLGNLEQLTMPVFDKHGASWSLDGKFITFISDSKIYIVDTAK